MVGVQGNAERKLSGFCFKNGQSSQGFGHFLFITPIIKNIK